MCIRDSTVSIEKNELLGKLLAKEGIAHNLLNAKNHEKEAEIIAQAGKLGAVTVATNMAGRGTDIMLGGNVTYMAKAALKKMCIRDSFCLGAGGAHPAGQCAAGCRAGRRCLCGRVHPADP